ncbi:MAG: RHS repeat-associated core domain-containing protein [Patescibacteria group bacterium]|jgi:RHS repeat-associated protein
MASIKKGFIYLLMVMFTIPNLPASAFAATPAAQPTPAPVSDTQFTLPPKPPITVPQEITDKRGEYSKTFQQPDGTMQAVVYSTPINYSATENGKTVWKEIDNNLLPTDNGYKNGANSFILSLPNQLSDKPVSISSNGNEVSFALEATAPAPNALNLSNLQLSTLFTPSTAVKNNQITYGNVTPGINVTYYAIPEGVKEEITLNQKPTQTSFVYHLQTTGVTAQKGDDGSISFLDKDQKTAFYIPKMTMWDARGGKDSEANEYSDAISVALEPETGGYVLTMTPDAQWLSDTARVYPVVIDPTVVVDLHYGEDSYVEQYYPNTSTWDQANLYVGNHQEGTYRKGLTRTLIPFSIPDLTDANIINATFTVRQKACVQICSVSGVTANLVPWFNSKTVNWNNQPLGIGEVGYQYGDSGPNYAMNVTNALKYWFESHNQNGSWIGALAFKSDWENPSGYRIWVAENDPTTPLEYEPRLTIDYRDYYAEYSTNNLGSQLIDTSGAIDVVAQNTGRNTWLKSDTHLSYHIYNSAGQLVTWDGVRTLLPRDIAPHGDGVVLNATVKIPSIPGNYTVKWDMVQEGVTWFSEQGVPTKDVSLTAIDYPAYGATYNLNNPPTSATANSTISLPMSVTNMSNQNWPIGQFQLGYHWVDSAGQTYIFNGTPQNFQSDVAKYGATGNILLNVPAPLNAGNYTLQLDMYQVNNKTWFSTQNVATKNIAIAITNPALSSSIHLGDEKYYTKAGPIDLATGNVAYSSTDMTVPSNTGLLAVGRSYNSTLANTPTVPDANGYIRSWLVNGPYRESNQAGRLSKAFIANEATAQPTVGSVSSSNLWFKTSSATPALDISAALASAGSVESGYNSNATVYAYTNVYVLNAKTYRLKIGSADGVKVWVNGNMVWLKDVLRGITLDSDSVDVPLLAGWNKVMFKVAHASSAWALSARFLNTDNTQITGLLLDTDNQLPLTTTATMGQGWRASFDEYLNFADPDNVMYQDGTGAVDIFSRNANGTYKRPTGLSIDLVKNADNTYAIISKSGLKTYFSSTGLLQKRVDLSGNTISYNRDTNGNVTKIVDGGRFITLTYTGKRLETVTNQLGQKITYSYNTTVTPFKLTSVIDPLGGLYAYQYTPAGKMTRYVDKNGSSTYIYYDIQNRVSEVKDALGNSSKLSYNNRSVDITDALGRKSNATFDQNNLLINFTNPKGYRQIYGNDGNYNVTTITPDLPENEYYYFNYTNTYDANDNLLTSKDPMDATTTNVYAGYDLVKTTDPKGNVTTATYSVDGRRLLLSTTDAKGNVDSATYDAKGHKVTVTDSKGAITKFTYTADGDVLTTVSPKLETSTFTYDTVGRKLTEKSAMGNTLTYAYDNLGRLTSIKDPAGITNRYEYDKNSNKLKDIDPKGNVTTYTYDKLNRQIKLTDAVGAITSTTFDAVGNVVKTTDAKGKMTINTYDELNQLTKTTDATGVPETAVYDRNGNITSATDQSGSTTTATTDKNGNATQITDKDGTTSVSYDKNDNVVQTTSTVKSENDTITYDKNDNVTAVQSNITGNNTLTYDKNDNVVTSAVSTATVATVYDANQEVSQVSTTLAQTGQVLTNILTKDAEGKLTAVKKPNGDTTSYTYDTSGRVKQVVNKYKAGAIQQQISYTYDANSNITTAIDSLTGTRTYAYDARDQLTGENGTTYSYDLMGNRTKKTTAAETITYAYDELGDANRLIKETSTVNGTKTYEYDKNGNVTKVTDSKNGITQYFYDADDYFIKAITPDNTTVEYTYNELTKQRATRTETSPTGVVSTTKFVYDGDKLVSETDAAGKMLRTYTWDEDENLSSVTIPDTNNNPQTYYYLKNGHSDITGLTDASGNRLVSYSYDAWGNVTVSTMGGPTPDSRAVPQPPAPQNNLDKLNPRLYAGYWYDSTIKLYYMKARMYDPSLGRFTSQDPVVADNTALGSNPYIYCNNSPLTHTDPSGKIIFLAPLIIYSPLILASLFYIANSPVMQCLIANDVSTVFDPNTTKTDKIIAGVGLVGDLTPVGGGSTTKTAANIAKTSTAVNTAKNVIKTESHHIIPKYLGGAAKAVRAIIPKEYHQQITNAFRAEVAYGKAAEYYRLLKQNDYSQWEKEVGEVIKKVYDKLPIDNFLKEIK